jgi:hypothetical protein
MQRMDPCVLLSTEEGIIQAFQEFFQNLFSSSSPVGVVECMAVADKKVSEEMNGALLKVCTHGGEGWNSIVSNGTD